MHTCGSRDFEISSTRMPSPGRRSHILVAAILEALGARFWADAEAASSTSATRRIAILPTLITTSTDESSRPLRPRELAHRRSAG